MMINDQLIIMLMMLMEVGHCPYQNMENPYKDNMGELRYMENLSKNNMVAQ